MRFYIVTWDLLRGGRYRGFITRVEAESRTEARAKVEERWRSHFKGEKIPHMFHVSVKWQRPGEEVLSVRRWF